MGYTGNTARFDFSNPFFTATIVTSDGRRFPLWTDPGAISRSTDASNLTSLPYLQQLVIEFNLGYLPKITATLTPPYREALDLLESDIIGWGSSFIEVQFGYVGSTKEAILSKTHRGLILKPEVTLGIDITVTLTAQGLSGFSTERQGGRRVFNGKTRLEIIQDIITGKTEKPKQLKGQNLSGASESAVKQPVNIDNKEGVPPTSRFNSDPARFPQASFPVTGQLPGVNTDSFSFRDIIIDVSEVTQDRDAESYNALRVEKLDTYVQGGRSDHDSMLELIRESRCFMYWDNNIVKILPRNFVTAGKKPKRFFRLYDYPNGSIGPANNTFPVLGLSSPSSWVFLPGETRGLFMADVSSTDRQKKTQVISDTLVKGAVTDLKSQVSRKGSKAVALETNSNYPAADLETGDGMKAFPGNPTASRELNQAKNEFVKAMNNSGVKVVIDTLADPTLFPGDVFILNGSGNKFDGKYVVFEQVFTFGTSGSTMQITGVGNTSPLSLGIPAEGKVSNNIDPVPEDDRVAVEAVDPDTRKPVLDRTQNSINETQENIQTTLRSRGR